MRILLENYVFNALPVELKQGIKTVVNSQSAWDIDTATLVTETTHDRLWVPSHNEYFNGNSIPKDVTGRLGSGMIHSINGFGVNEMLGRSLLGNNYSYTYNSVDPTSTGHGGSSSSLYTFGDVMICFGL